MAHLFEMTQNGTLTLHTTGKTCREDIKVNVNVEGGGEVTETILEPTEVTENHCWNREFDELIEQENCDFYEYSITEMFGNVVKVKTILPPNCGVIFADDFENEVPFNWYVENYDSDVEAEKEFAISGNDFSIRFSCVRTEGFPQVTVVSNGGGSVSLTPCFDGSISGEYVDNNLTTLRIGAFAGTNLTKISLPNCKEIKGSRQFNSCTNLVEVELPEVDTAAELTYTFSGSPKLERVSFPKLKTTGGTGACFDGCTNLKRVDFPLLSGVTLGNYAFRNCSNLETLVIGGATLCPLNSGNVFNGVSTTWKLYVNDNLVSAYQKATNWVNHASRIYPMSALPEG